ncbi:lipopolysaccharide biosynthesis protein [Mycolicibacterium diernhoferi]|nr:lipopolysaccharide biosynthesis protein [Mycolicibacterium diernhoferi]
MGGQFVRILVQSIGVVVMARILLPEDFGLLAMVIAIIGVGDILRDFGLSAAAVQAADLSVKQRSNLFWLNTLLGGVIGGIAYLASWSIASLYGDPRLVAITQVLAVTFLFNGIAAQFRANLQRSLAFTSLVVAELAGLTTGVAAGIIGGLAGWGYWALVFQFVINSAVVMTVLGMTSKWLPRGYYRGEETRKFIRFGLDLFGYQLLNYSSKNIDSILIGQQFGATALGYYNRAFQLLTLPLSQIASPLLRVALPVLSKVQADIRTFNIYLAKAQSALLAAMLFLLIALGALAEPAVEIVLGDEWLPTAELFRILSIAGVFQMLSYPILWGYLALGLTRTNLKQALISRPLTIALIIGGALISVEGVAWAYALGNAIAWPIALAFLARTSSVDVRPLFRSSVQILFANAMGGIAAFSITHWAQLDNPWGQIAIGVSVMAGVTAAVILLVPPLRRAYAEVFRSGLKSIRR